MKEQIICRVLTGPTGSGKSEIAMQLAEENGWAILCMDSMQIYRRMDIGTAKPTPAERKKVPHYLLDLCEPDESFSVSRYIEAAEQCVREQHETGKEVLFVGGTGLYLEGMMKPMAMGNTEADESLRQELHLLAEKPDGLLLLDQRLRESDPATADKLPMNDIRRRIRAIEVYEATGIPFSRQENRRTESPFRWIPVSLWTEREELYRRINIRTERMIASGLAEEVKSLLQSGIPEDAQSMQAIGYKEMVPFLRGALPLEWAVSEIQKRTRHYAKRQITYLKRMDEIRYVETERKDRIERIRNIFMEGQC